MMRLVLLIALLLAPKIALAGEVTVAVASNFLATAEAVSEKFETATGHRVTLTHGSTGQIYAQIAAGAPFDIFLSADTRRPELLVRGGLASETGTYAIGQLVLVSALPITRETATEVFQARTAALADPTVAPYGLAATAAMEGLSLDTATFRPVLVANVGQVAVVFTTGNAELAFLSAAQLPMIEAPHVLDIEGLYPRLVQDAALLTRGRGNEAAEAFWAWLFSDEARSLIGAAGYELPG